MLTTRHLHLTHEAAKWLAILTLASLLAAVVARFAAGEEAALSSRSSTVMPAVTEPAPDSTALWKLLAEHKNEDFAAAIGAWPDAPLAYDAEVWRHVALAQAYLGQRQLESASEALDMAQMIEPDNAVAHYFRGILRLEQAATAGEWYDAIEPTPIATPAEPPATATTHEPALTKSMYQLAARMEFEKAIENADSVWFDMTLKGPESAHDSAAEPTVRELLAVLGAEDFVGKAHHQLSYLLLDHGTPQEAELHLDAAISHGLRVLYGYRDLGRAFEQRHQHAAAARAYAKHMLAGGEFAYPAARILYNLRLALLEEI